MQGHRTGISPDFWCRGGRRRSNAGEMVYRFVEFASVTLEFPGPADVDNLEGMTGTYNRFHDIRETDPRIVELRELHAAVERAVLMPTAGPTS